MLKTENYRLKQLISILETNLPRTEIPVSVSFSNSNLTEQDNTFRLATAVVVLSKVHEGLRRNSEVSIEQSDISTETFTVGASPKLVSMVCDEHGCLIIKGSALSEAKLMSQDSDLPVVLNENTSYELYPHGYEVVLVLPLGLYDDAPVKDELWLILNRHSKRNS